MDLKTICNLCIWKEQCGEEELDVCSDFTPDVQLDEEEYFNCLKERTDTYFEIICEFYDGWEV